MNFEDLKEQLKEKFVGLSHQIQESAAWNQLTEQYQNLSPMAQRAALIGLGLLACLIVFAAPLMFISSSSDLMEEFEDKRQLVRDAYRISRDAKISPPPARSPSNLAGMARSRLESSRLTSDQIESIEPSSAIESASGISKALHKEGLEIKINKINLSQVVEIGYDLQNLHSTVKMAGLSVRANAEDSHFFDVVYRLIAMSVPDDSEDLSGKKSIRSKEKQ